ncbi:predicted protein [Arabidopsis lyrata subsp. lyrata]|uniref:Predicted protein n=1 Tax=Arabidopsis lyrata subsp. lyrata TaxID=81972 RepID=D7LSD0_ARALL|nr:predicted protein [Arabidopsis lyrata subsp. lyrata]
MVLGNVFRNGFSIYEKSLVNSNGLQKTGLLGNVFRNGFSIYEKSLVNSNGLQKTGLLGNFSTGLMLNKAHLPVEKLLTASFSTNPKGGGSGDDPAFQESRLWNEKKKRLANLGQISKNIENESKLFTPNLKNVDGLAKFMDDLATELEDLYVETMSFGEDEEKNGKDGSLMHDLSKFMMDAYEKLKKGESVVRVVFGNFGFTTFNSFEDATKTANNYALLGQEVKLDEDELDDYSYTLICIGYKGWILKGERKDFCPPFKFP